MTPSSYDPALQKLIEAWDRPNASFFSDSAEKPKPKQKNEESEPKAISEEKEDGPDDGDSL